MNKSNHFKLKPKRLLHNKIHQEVQKNQKPSWLIKVLIKSSAGSYILMENMITTVINLTRIKDE